MVSLIKTWIEFHPNDFEEGKLRSQLDRFNNEVILKEIPEGGKLIQGALDDLINATILYPQQRLFPPIAILDPLILKPENINFDGSLFLLFTIQTMILNYDYYNYYYYYYYY